MTIILCGGPADGDKHQVTEHFPEWVVPIQTKLPWEPIRLAIYKPRAVVEGVAVVPFRFDRME